MKLIDADIWMNLPDDLPYKGAVKRVLIRAPEAVVRCKDCAKRDSEDCAMFYRCNCGEQHTWETDDDFCSYGERKEHK